MERKEENIFLRNRVSASACFDKITLEKLCCGSRHHEASCDASRWVPSRNNEYRSHEHAARRCRVSGIRRNRITGELNCGLIIDANIVPWSGSCHGTAIFAYEWEPLSAIDVQFAFFACVYRLLFAIIIQIARFSTFPYSDPAFRLQTDFTHTKYTHILIENSYRLISLIQKQFHAYAKTRENECSIYYR